MKLALANKLARRADKLLDEKQRKRLRELNGVERLLFTKLMKQLVEELEESDGRITSRKGFVSLGKAVDAIFDAVEEQGLGKLGSNMAKDMHSVVATNADYFKAIQTRVKGGGFKEIRTTVMNTMRRRLGIDQEGGIQSKGYLDQLFATQTARDEVKKMVEKAVTAGIPMKKLERQLRVKVQGSRTTAGVLEKHLGGFVLDTYQKADSITNNEFGKRLGMRFFIYSGGLIETSRQFCIKKNGKVFSIEEAEREWPKDKALPRTKAEEESGVITDYIPMEDRGRWRCRHRLLPIPDELAFEMRPELKNAA